MITNTCNILRDIKTDVGNYLCHIFVHSLLYKDDYFNCNIK